MKVVMKPIQVCAIWDEDGNIRPIAFCFTEKGEKIKIAVETQSSEEQRIAGHLMIHFFCRSEIQGVKKTVCLRYDIYGRKWYLYKI